MDTSVKRRNLIPQEYGQTNQVGGQAKFITGSSEQVNPWEAEEDQEQEIEDAIEEQKRDPRGVDWIFRRR